MRYMPLLCATVSQLKLLYFCNIVYYTNDANLIRRTSDECNFETQLVMSNLTSLLKVISAGYIERKRFTIITTYSAMFSLRDSTAIQYEHSGQLALTRWLYVVDPAGTNSRSVRLEPTNKSAPIDRFNYLECISFIINTSTIDVPVDFRSCTRRAKLKEDAVQKIERFSRDQIVIVCLHTCSFTPDTAKDDETFVAQAARFLNASYSKIMLDPSLRMGQLMEKMYELLGTRQADLSFYPLAHHYERLKRVSLIQPTVFINYRLVSRRRHAHTLHAVNLTRLFDLPTCVLVLLYSIAYVAFVGVLSNDVSEAFSTACACLLGQSYPVPGRAVLKMSALSLYIAGFFLGSIFRNRLTSCLNIKVPILLDTASDLERALDAGEITDACLAKFEHYTQQIDSSARDRFLRLLGRLNDSGRLQLYGDKANCIRNLRKHIRTVSILAEPYRLIKTPLEQTRLYVSHTIAASLGGSYPLAGGHPLEGELSSLSLRQFEMDADFAFALKVKQRQTLTKSAVETPKATSMSDLRASCFMLLSGYVLAMSAFLVTHS